MAGLVMPALKLVEKLKVGRREKRSEEKMKLQKLLRESLLCSTVKNGRTNISPPISDMRYGVVCST